MSRWMDEVEVVQELMNKSMAHLPDFRPWEREAVAGLLEPFKSIADPDLILFAEIEGRTIGWFPGVANLNEVLIHLDGLRRPWDMLRALRWMRLQAALPGGQERPDPARVLGKRRRDPPHRRDGLPRAREGLHVGRPLPHVG